MRWSLVSRAAIASTRSARSASLRAFVTQHNAQWRCDSRSSFTKRVQLHQIWNVSARNYSSSSDNQNDSVAEQQSKSLTDRKDDADGAAERKAQVEALKQEQPSYQLTFTCAKCLDRSTHRISKQGYHHGTVLVTCPGCKNKHLISDHLRIFSEEDVTLEDIMKEKGELLKKGVLGADGDVEFYPEPDENSINQTVVDDRRPPG